MAVKRPAPGRVVTIVVPSRMADDGKMMEKITRSVLGKLGCDGCHSGFDFRYITEQVFNANAKGEVIGG